MVSMASAIYDLNFVSVIVLKFLILRGIDTDNWIPTSLWAVIVRTPNSSTCSEVSGTCLESHLHGSQNYMLPIHSGSLEQGG
jgi:hypothetical protein